MPKTSRPRGCHRGGRRAARVAPGRRGAIANSERLDGDGITGPGYRARIAPTPSWISAGSVVGGWTSPSDEPGRGRCRPPWPCPSAASSPLPQRPCRRPRSSPGPCASTPGGREDSAAIRPSPSWPPGSRSPPVPTTRSRRAASTAAPTPCPASIRPACASSRSWGPRYVLPAAPGPRSILLGRGSAGGRRSAGSSPAAATPCRAYSAVFRSWQLGPGPQRSGRRPGSGRSRRRPSRGNAVGRAGRREWARRRRRGGCSSS